MRGKATTWRGSETLALAVLLAAFFALAPGAQAQRGLLSENAVPGLPQTAPEAACGLALDGEAAYLSSYYEHLVYLLEPEEEPEMLEADPIDGPCQLALGPSGQLYANDYHRRVERLLPTPLVFPGSEVTGLAVDPTSGNVYANERTKVSVYSPTGVLQQTIGSGSLVDAYGLALFSGRLYVPDNGSSSVKVFEPATSTTVPVLTIDGEDTPLGRFNSLFDATIAIDPSNEHVLVIDNLQPGFERPEAAIEEFEADGTFLGEVSRRVVDAEPSAIAFRSGGMLVTSGNSEGSRVFEYGGYEAAPAFAPLSAPAPIAPEARSASVALAAAVPASASVPASAAKKQRFKARKQAHRKHRARQRGKK